MDKLKEYLLRHKTDLDVDSPASDAWEYLRPVRSGSSRRRVWYAAAACVMALAGAGIWLVIRDNKPLPDTTKIKRPAMTTAPATTAPAPVTTASAMTAPAATAPAPAKEKAADKDIAKNISTPKRAGAKVRTKKPAQFTSEIDAIDKSYSHLIDYQLRKLRATPLYAENGSYFSFYVEQFRQMDQDEQEVRNDIKRYGLTNEFLEQLINVYQQKLNVLKNLQTEINKMNNKVRENQSPLATPPVHYLNI